MDDRRGSDWPKLSCSLAFSTFLPAQPLFKAPVHRASRSMLGNSVNLNVPPCSGAATRLWHALFCVSIICVSRPYELRLPETFCFSSKAKRPFVFYRSQLLISIRKSDSLQFPGITVFTFTVQFHNLRLLT